MKLIGYEVCNYGLFERYFIPLTPGLRVLSGLNNVGKTSLLRALTLFSQSADLPYLHEGDASRVGLVYELNQRDFQELIDSNYVSENESSQLLLRADFSPRSKFFLGITVLDGETETVWKTHGGGNVLSINIFHPNRALHSRRSNMLPIHGANIGPQLDRVVEDFNRARSSIYIPAQRNGAAQTQAAMNEALPSTGLNLASYLATLQLNKTDQFDELNQMFCTVFPYLSRVNAQTLGSNVEVRITYKDSAKVIPLSAAGTGVEQLLILLTCITRSDDQAIIAIDEPHSYLHPNAERALIRFLSKYPEKTILLATHSPSILNSVSADRIMYLDGKSKRKATEGHIENRVDMSKMLSDLGYQNSDVLFNNRLLFVEGPSEATILPRLLEKADIDPTEIAWTGFPQLCGANPVRTIDDLAIQVVKFEKLINALGRNTMRRTYIFDGDRDVRAIERLSLGNQADALFLSRPELENYLLEPRAIMQAMMEEGKALDLAVEITENEISVGIERAEMEGCRKGSAILERIYGLRLLKFDKVHGGSLLASKISIEHEGFIGLLGELRPLFGE